MIKKARTFNWCNVSIKLHSFRLTNRQPLRPCAKWLSLSLESLLSICLISEVKPPSIGIIRKEGRSRWYIQMPVLSKRGVYIKKATNTYNACIYSSWINCGLDVAYASSSSCADPTGFPGSQIREE